MLKKCSYWIVFVVCLFSIGGLLHVALPIGGDSTDPPNGASGVSLVIDHATGCHYLKPFLFGSLTPRLDANGQQICTGEEGEEEMRRERGESE